MKHSRPSTIFTSGAWVRYFRCRHSWALYHTQPDGIMDQKVRQSTSALRLPQRFDCFTIAQRTDDEIRLCGLWTKDKRQKKSSWKYAEDWLTIIIFLFVDRLLHNKPQTTHASSGLSSGVQWAGILSHSSWCCQSPTQLTIWQNTKLSNKYWESNYWRPDVMRKLSLWQENRGR